MPKSVFSFEDSIGFLAHFSTHHSPYQNSPDKFINAFEQLHMRNIRGGGNGSTKQSGWYDRLCANGVRHTLGFPIGATPDSIADEIAQYRPGCIIAVEPMNEYDAFALNPAHPDPNWVTTLTRAQRVLWNTIKSNPKWSQITVLGPGLSSISRYPKLGNLESISDAGNYHDGTCDGSPLTHHYKNIADKLRFVRAAYPTKPLWVGETNYANNPKTSFCAVSKEVAARYVPRMFLERFNLGEPHTFYNELADNPDEGPGWGTLGLMNPQADPYPAYTALQSLLGTMPQDYSAGALVPLQFEINGDLANVHHTLLQAANGTYYAFLWLEVDSWDVKAKHDLNPRPQTVSITVPSRIHTASLYTPDSEFTLTRTTVSVHRSMRVKVSDSPEILELR